MSEITDEEWQKMTPEQRTEFQMKNCIFCKIIKGEIPSKKVYEDSDFIGILDINPGNKGHTILLPKKHFQIMPHLGTELNGKLGIAIKAISKKIKESLNTEATTIFVANGAVAGQNAPHLMIHIIPRKDGDEINLNPELKKSNPEKIKAIRQNIIKSLGLPDPAIENKPDKKNKEQEIQKDTKENKKINEKQENTIIKQETTKITQEQEIQNQAKNKPDKNLLDKIAKMFD